MVKEGNRWMETSDGILMVPSLIWKARIEARLHDSLAGSILAALTQMRRACSDLKPAAVGHEV